MIEVISSPRRTKVDAHDDDVGNEEELVLVLSYT